MDLVTALGWLAAACGVLMSVADFPQAYRIWKNKSAKDVSLTMFAILSFGTLVWTLYGLAKNDWIIISGFVFGFFGSTLVLILKLKYDKPRKSRENYTTKKP